MAAMHGGPATAPGAAAAPHDCSPTFVSVSPDGRFVIVTNKKAQSVSVIDPQLLTEVARIPTSKKLPHGIAFAPEGGGRWAFISVESIGIDPGAVDVIDLWTLTRVASIAVPLQPTGITILPRP